MDSGMGMVPGYQHGRSRVTRNWNSLYELLNGMWQDERRNAANSEELAAHAGAMSKFKQ
jgi:hypothetical protein